MDRVSLIREGLPYETIEVIGKRVDLPAIQMLRLFGIPQTTYNKKKRYEVLLSRDSEVILILTKLLDFGVEVFNSEIEKFQRWLKKPNISLVGVTPVSLFDSLTGIQEVRNSLNRLDTETWPDACIQNRTGEISGCYFKRYMSSVNRRVPVEQP